MRRHYDWLVVGAGFTGAVFAERMASQAGRRVLVIDRRPTLGGNAHDSQDETGLWRHVYGPHLFHTNARAVVDYLSAFTDWLPYVHRVRAVVDGRFVPMPFNFTSLEACFPPAVAAKLERALLAEYGPEGSVPIIVLRGHADPLLRDFAEEVYEKLYRGYSQKQWGMDPAGLSPAVTGRVPIRMGRDDRYFQDSFQGQPREGFTRLFERLLAHESIDLLLGTALADLGSDISYDRMLYTGPLDAFFGHEHGELPYRSLRFAFERREGPRHLPVTTVNYPGAEPFTRATDFGHLSPGERSATTLVFEYPQDHRPGENEPYYPVPCAEAERLRETYAALAAALAPRVVFAGRLADYRYINMDQAVARALSIARRAAAREPVGEGLGELRA
jgi:UDP-galactopyranose mutase